MNLDWFAESGRFRQMWNSVRIVRSVRYSLFTFGDSDLPYFLVCGPSEQRATVSIKQGMVKVSRPLIITAQNAPPEFRNFFEGQEDEAMTQLLLSRLARVRDMKFDNVITSEQYVSDSLDETAARINQTLDKEEEDRVAILTAPAGLGGIAVLRYCLERVADSAPDNLTELRERGLLP